MVEIDRSIQKACFHFQWIWNSSIFLVNHCKFLTNAGSLNFLSQTAKSDFDKFNIQYICHAWTNSIPRNTSRDIRLFWQNLNVWKRSLYAFLSISIFLGIYICNFVFCFTQGRLCGFVISASNWFRFYSTSSLGASDRFRKWHFLSHLVCFVLFYKITLFATDNNTISLYLIS